MKDITRIHIAKVTYSIELDAKKLLEKYLDNLEAYSDDNELLNDIEIRMTELLGERGVKPEGVIAEADVIAIRQQLGEPKDFMVDDGAVDNIDILKESGRKLYRNLDNAVIGGVLSGIASYFGIKAIWIRLIFIVLTVISWGLVVLLYIILWAVIPPAKTAADKLRMQGRPVTLASIRELNESPVDEYIKIRTARIRRLFSVLLGVASIGVALAVVDIYITVWLHYTYTYTGQVQTYFPVTSDLSTSDPIYLGAYILSGLSLLVLCVMAARSAFARKITKRMIVSGIIIIVATGLIVGGAYGYELYSEWQTNQKTASNTRENQVKVPNGFSSINAIKVNIPAYIDVNYIVDSSQRSITFKSTKGLTLDTSVTDKTATISFNPNTQPLITPMSTVTIYGPELNTITTKDTHFTYRSNIQDQLTINAQGAVAFTIDKSSIKNVTANLDSDASLSGYNSSIESVDVNITGKSVISLGTIKSLNVTSPDVCAVDAQTNIDVNSIRDSTYTHNGISTASDKSFNDICIAISIDSQVQYYK